MKFEELYEGYGRCLYPKVVITIDHVEKKATPEEVHVSLSMMKKANSCTIVYRFTTEKELLDMRKNIKIGSVIQLSLGYDTSVEDVFLGYVHSLESTQYTYDFTFEIYAQDVMGLMMNHQRLQHYKEKSAQQILNDILEDNIYSPFIKKRTMQKQKDILDTYTSWMDNDFETIKNICEEKDFVFYLCNDEFIVEAIGISHTPEIHFSNFGIIFIRQIHCAQNMKGNIILQGFDKDYKSLECKQIVDLAKDFFDSSICNKITKVKRYETIVDQSILKTKAQNMGKKISLETSSIHFSCIYVPQLQCGRKLNFEAIACIQASCILSEVNVTLRDNHFTCEAEAILV